MTEKIIFLTLTLFFSKVTTNIHNQPKYVKLAGYPLADNYLNILGYKFASLSDVEAKEALWNEWIEPCDRVRFADNMIMYGHEYTNNKRRLIHEPKGHVGHMLYVFSSELAKQSKHKPVDFTITHIRQKNINSSYASHSFYIFKGQKLHTS